MVGVPSDFDGEKLAVLSTVGVCDLVTSTESDRDSDVVDTENVRNPSLDPMMRSTIVALKHIFGSPNIVTQDSMTKHFFVGRLLIKKSTSKKIL